MEMDGWIKKFSFIYIYFLLQIRKSPKGGCGDLSGLAHFWTHTHTHVSRKGSLAASLLMCVSSYSVIALCWAVQHQHKHTLTSAQRRSYMCALNHRGTHSSWGLWVHQDTEENSTNIHLHLKHTTALSCRSLDGPSHDSLMKWMRSSKQV